MQFDGHGFLWLEVRGLICATQVVSFEKELIGVGVTLAGILYSFHFRVLSVLNPFGSLALQFILLLVIVGIILPLLSRKVPLLNRKSHCVGKISVLSRIAS